MHRRDLLRMFSIGTVIAPVIDGMPTEVRGKLIKEPSVELISATHLPAPDTSLTKALCHGLDNQTWMTVEVTDSSGSPMMRARASVRNLEFRTDLHFGNTLTATFYVDDFAMHRDLARSSRLSK